MGSQAGGTEGGNCPGATSEGRALLASARSALEPPVGQRCLQAYARPFSAVAELLDNASHRSVAAGLFCIDVVKLKGHLCLTFTDDGAGMTPHRLRHMLSCGFAEKTAKRDGPAGGLYGFKTSSMRLGKDAVVFTKTGGALSVGLLSQTYMDHVRAETVIIPLLTFNQQNNELIFTKDSVSSLETILEHTLFNTREELLAQFDAIPGKKGTHILIWNIHRNKDGKLELDFDTDEQDIRIAGFPADSGEIPCPEAEYSLRAYCSILYLKPRMQISLRQKKVNTQLIAKSLAHVEYDFYKPIFARKKAKITFGFTCKNKNQYGLMMYHNNRLIRFYKKVGCQRKGGGVGVIGVMECNFLNPARNKEGFEEDKVYRRTVTVVGRKLRSYWKAKMAQMSLGSTDAACVTAERPDQMWVQCEECLKWRRLPNQVDPASLPESWFCCLHPLPKYRSCLVPEEQEYSDEEKRPTHREKFQKGELDREKRLSLSSPRESKEQHMRQEGDGCRSQHKESLDA